MEDLHEPAPASERRALRPLPTQPIPLVTADVEAVPVLIGPVVLPLGSLESSLALVMDGTRSVREVAELTGLLPSEALYVIAGMLHEGMITMRGRTFVDFADVFEELGIEQTAPGATTPTQHRAAQLRDTLPIDPRRGA